MILPFNGRRIGSFLNLFGRILKLVFLIFGLESNEREMKIIWYNPDQKQYKYGGTEQFNDELITSSNKDAYTILMKFDRSSNGLATKVLKQLNLINSTTKIPSVL